MSKPTYVPVAPGDAVLIHLAADTEEKAWKNLLKHARHMPYKTVENFKRRGYTVEKWENE